MKEEEPREAGVYFRQGQCAREKETVDFGGMAENYSLGSEPQGLSTGVWVT